MKNRVFLNKLMISFVVITIGGAYVLFSSSKHIMAYIIVGCLTILAIVIGIMIWFFKKKSTPEITNLTTFSSSILQLFLIIVVVLLSVYLIPVEYFIVSVILIVSTILFNILFLQKLITISDKGIRYGIKWTLKWEEINTYTIDKENKTFYLYMKSGECKKISSLNDKHCKNIETGYIGQISCFFLDDVAYRSNFMLKMILNLLK